MSPKKSPLPTTTKTNQFQSKNMRLISSFWVLILVFLFLAQFQETNGKGLISKACETSLHKDLCKDTLKADPGSKRASLHNLAKIALKAALTNGTAMQNEIHALLKSKSGTSLESALKDCKENYNNAVSQLQNSNQAIENKRYNDVNTWVTAAMNDAESCEEGFKDADKQSPICKKNTVFGQLCSNVLAVTNKAAAASATESSSTGSSAQGGHAAQGGQGQDQVFQGSKSAGSKGKGSNVQAPGAVTLKHAKIALKAAIEGAEKASKDIIDLQRARTGSSFESVLKDCRENYKSAHSQLKNSLEALDNHRYNDVNTWVTAAMNDAESCEEGFKDEAKDSLTAKLNTNLGKLCSTVLAITNKLAASTADSRYKIQASEAHNQTTAKGSTAKQPRPPTGPVTDDQAKTALKAALDSAYQVQKEINTLAATKTGTSLEYVLKDCKENYDDAVSQLTNCNEALASKRYKDVNAWVTAAMNDAESCKEGFKDDEKESPVVKTSTSFTDLCSNVLAITNKLAASA